MALDDFNTIWNRLLLRCPSVDPNLAQDFVKDAFRQLAERRRWSWKIKFGQIVIPPVYNTGTVTVTNNFNTVTGSGTAWDATLVGRQFRTGSTSPIFTIVSVESATSLTIDEVWGAATASAQSYEIYQAYVTPPSDFHSFVNVIDTNYNWRLGLNVNNSDIDEIDAQRSNSGNPYVLSAVGYTTAYTGIVNQPVQAVGTGPDPTSTGTYTGVADALFIIECTLGGTSGTAEFKWKKNGGSYITGVVTDSNAQDLQDGVQIYWPLVSVYVQGDVWVVRTTAVSNPGLPRYELWPHQKSRYVYPIMYECRPLDLDDPGAVLPRYIRGDVLLWMALAECARWPGAEGKPNPYYNLNLAAVHDNRAERMIMELERQDDEVMEQDVRYQRYNLPYAMALGDSDWLQSHAI